MTTNNNDYDLENEFQSEIYPLIQQLHARCKELGISLVIGTTYGMTDEGDGLSYQSSLAMNVLGKKTTPQLHAAANILDPDEELDLGTLLKVVEHRAGLMGVIGIIAKAMAE